MFNASEIVFNNKINYLSLSFPFSFLGVLCERDDQTRQRRAVISSRHVTILPTTTTKPVHGQRVRERERERAIRDGRSTIGVKIFVFNWRCAFFVFSLIGLKLKFSLSRSLSKFGNVCVC